MSFVIAAPEMVEAAAQNLAGIRSLLSEATATAAGPTTGVVAAAQDEVSAAVAALFGQFGQDYQAISAQAQAFHGRFVNLLNAGAGAYLSADVANAEQALTSAANAPVQALHGGGAAATSAATAAAGIVGPYESLFANTVANLRSIGSIWTNVTAPALVQAITTHAYPQLIIGALATGNPVQILGATGQVAQGYANLMQNLTVPMSLSITSLNPPNASVAVGVGLPELLAFDALGGPVNAALAASSSGTAILNAVQTGNPLAVINAFVDAPANVANAFLNGETTLPVPMPFSGQTLTVAVPFGGLLAPLQPFTTTATLPANPIFQTVTVTGPPTGGLLPALLEYAPQLLASAFGS
jgi:PE family